MSRGRHRMEPVRRPLPRRLVAAAGGVCVLTLPLGVAAWQSTDRSAPAVQAAITPGDDATESYAALDARQLTAALDARERARADRNRTPGTPAPSAEASATAEESATAEASPTAEESASAAPAAASAEPAPAETATQPPPVPDVVGQLWATTDVNVRSGPSTGHDRIGSLAARTQVDVTGATENGWSQVVIDGQAGWVNSDYLSETEPAPEPAAAAVSNASCPISSSIEANLTANARAVYRAVCAAFPGSASSYGGYRPGDRGDHGSGRAVDIMVSGEPGWDIARFVQARAGELGVTYVIYEQRIWMAGDPASRWEWMENRGSATANHYDHVHVSVS